MKPLVINITIEKLVDRIEAPQGGRASKAEKALNKMQKEVVFDSLNKIIKNSVFAIQKSENSDSALGSCLCSVRNYARARQLLHELIGVANQAIDVIDSKKSSSEICDIAVEKIDELTSKISTAILGDCTSLNNFDSRI